MVCFVPPARPKRRTTQRHQHRVRRGQVVLYHHETLSSRWPGPPDGDGSNPRQRRSRGGCAHPCSRGEAPRGHRGLLPGRYRGAGVRRGRARPVLRHQKRQAAPKPLRLGSSARVPVSFGRRLPLFVLSGKTVSGAFLTGHPREVSTDVVSNMLIGCSWEPSYTMVDWGGRGVADPFCAELQIRSFLFLCPFPVVPLSVSGHFLSGYVANPPTRFSFLRFAAGCWRDVHPLLPGYAPRAGLRVPRGDAGGGDCERGGQGSTAVEYRRGRSRKRALRLELGAGSRALRAIPQQCRALIFPLCSIQAGHRSV